jgi:hypothetical protein
MKETLIKFFLYTVGLIGALSAPYVFAQIVPQDTVVEAPVLDYKVQQIFMASSTLDAVEATKVLYDKQSINQITKRLDSIITLLKEIIRNQK